MTFNWVVINNPNASEPPSTDDNRAPVIVSPTPDIESVLGEPILVSYAAHDPDGDTLTWSISGLPPGLTYDATLGCVTGTLANEPEVIGSYTVTINVSDGKEQTSATFRWTVGRFAIDDGGPQWYAVGERVSRHLEVRGEPNGPLAFAYADLPMGVAPNEGNSALLEGTIDSASCNQSVYWVQSSVTASDGQHEDSASMVWLITRMSFAPVNHQFSALEEEVALPLTLSGVPVGRNLTYSSTNLPAGLRVTEIEGRPWIVGTISREALPEGVDQLEYDVTVAAETQFGGRVSVSFTWTVAALVIEPIPDVISIPGDYVEIRPVVRGPAEWLQGGLQFTYIGQPSSLTYSTYTGLLSGEPTPEDIQEEPYRVQVQVQDQFGHCAQLAFHLQVQQVKVSFQDEMGKAISKVVGGYRLDQQGRVQPIEVKFMIAIESAVPFSRFYVGYTGQDRFGRTADNRIYLLATSNAGERKISVRVGGGSATPADKPNRDCWIVVYDNNGTPDDMSDDLERSRIPFVVLIPYSVRLQGYYDPLKPNSLVSSPDTFTCKVNGKPAKRNPWTRPPYHSPRFTSNKQWVLGSSYGVDAAIQVHDQFKQPLASIYINTPVEEKIEGGGEDKFFAINATLDDKGYYPDHTGPFYFYEVRVVDGKPMVTIYHEEDPKDSYVIDTFLRGAGVADLLKKDEGKAKILLRIGGHVLAGRIERFVIVERTGVREGRMTVSDKWIPN
ncbi:MAG: Ig domain-containing protein [Gemmatales bacterium]|nr:Ig domain-containing protein [Gemmatales bacterium]MDW8175293.1 Ig domain-containing protein [Gemmatales bacterium]